MAVVSSRRARPSSAAVRGCTRRPAVGRREFWRPVETRLQPVAVEFGQFEVEAVAISSFHLGNEAGWTHDQNAIGSWRASSSVQMRPGLDRLAEADLIRDEQPRVAGLQGTSGPA